MWNKPTKNQLSKIPRFYETEDIPLEDKLIYMHFFIGACNWYIAEFNGEDIFFGYANLGDDQMAEWGYISLSELDEIYIDGLEVDCDLHWEVIKFKDIIK